MQQYSEFNLLLQMTRALADETRLRIVSLLCQQERNVGELAALLHLKEPTVSHHLSKIREAGLASLRAEGNQRFYSINKSQLARLSDLVSRISTIDLDMTETTNDTDWIDALDMSDEDRKVLKTYTVNGKLTAIPTKMKKHMVIMRWLATLFEADRHYTEKEVNEIITRVHPDYAGLRRDLVEFGFMRRERGGGDYWLTPEDETA
ncbi:MAG: hypothetical protein OHK0046_48740 [Anaerolineae bacterium]